MTRTLFSAMRPVCLAAALFVTIPAVAQDEGEEGHMHGPDGRHVAVASTFGTTAGKSILSHHDLMITDMSNPGPKGEGTLVIGCDVHSTVYPRNDRTKPIHREHNAYEPENGVYGSHMMYKQPGEYVIVEKVTMPDKKEYTLEFPVWVPAVTSPASDGKGQPASTLWPWGVGAALLVVVAYMLGRRSGRGGVAGSLIALALLGATLPLSSSFAQDEGEEGHMHGPDGRHLAVAGTFGTPVSPLKAYPTADLKDAAVQTIEKYRFRLSIENEEMAPPDPDVITLSKESAEAIGLSVVPVTAHRHANALVTTGMVRPNPNQAVTVNSHVGGRIVRVGATSGDAVRAGHVIAVIDSPEIADAQSALAGGRGGVLQAEAAKLRAASSVRESEAMLAQAQSELALADGKAASLQKTLERQRALAAAGAFSQQPVESAKSAVASAEGEMQSAQSALAQLESEAVRLESGLREGLVARKEVEAAQSLLTQGRTRVTTARRQQAIAQAAMDREEKLNTAGLRNAKEVQQAEADEEAARNAVQIARAVAAGRQRSLEGAASGLREAQALVARARQAVSTAMSRLQMLGVGPDTGSHVAITAPIGGEVLNRSASVGQTISAGQVLCTILNTGSLWVETDVFEKDVARIRLGLRVSIGADAVPGRTFDGVVGYIGGEVNPETRAVRVRTVVANPGGALKPNMFVRVAIGASGSAATVTIPEEAVQEEGGEHVVFVVEGEGYRRRIIQLSGNLGDRVIVKSGLKPGDTVVTQGAYQLLAHARKG